MAMAGKGALERLSPAVERALRARVGDGKAPLYDVARYHFGWGPGPHDVHVGRDMGERPLVHGTVLYPAPAERVHGALCLLSAQAFAGDTERALPAAAAVELLKAASQIHEDLRLGNPQRAARPAVWWAFGHAQAINAGDGLYALARLALMEGDSQPPEAILERLALMDAAWLEGCAARYREIEADANGLQTLDGRLAVIQAEDGALMGLAAALGAMAAGAPTPVRAALEGYGRAAGTARRLQEELDTLTGALSEEDLVQVLDKKRSAPFLHALQQATEEQRRSLQRIADREQPIDDAALLLMRTVVDEAGGRAYVQGLIAEKVRQALDALKASGAETLPLSQTVQALVRGPG